MGSTSRLLSLALCLILFYFLLRQRMIASIVTALVDHQREGGCANCRGYGSDRSRR